MHAFFIIFYRGREVSLDWKVFWVRSSQPFSYDTFPFSHKCSVNVFSFCFVLVFWCWFFFFLSVEHPEDSSENNRYIFSDSEEGCNESDFAVGKSCLSNVSYFYNLLYLLGHFSGFYKFPEDMKAGFIQEEGEHLTDFLICFKCWFKVN